MALDTALGQLLIEGASSYDPGGKFLKVYSIIPAASTTATALADTARTMNGSSISGTLAHAAGKLVYVRGFRITAAPIAVSVAGVVNLTGLVAGKTFQYEIAALVGAVYSLGEDFGDTGLAANDGSTDVVLTVPALALATVSLDIWGYRI